MMMMTLMGVMQDVKVDLIYCASLLYKTWFSGTRQFNSFLGFRDCLCGLPSILNDTT